MLDQGSGSGPSRQRSNGGWRLWCEPSRSSSQSGSGQRDPGLLERTHAGRAANASTRRRVQPPRPRRALSPALGQMRRASSRTLAQVKRGRGTGVRLRAVRGSSSHMAMKQATSNTGVSAATWWRCGAGPRVTALAGCRVSVAGLRRLSAELTVVVSRGRAYEHRQCAARAMFAHTPVSSPAAWPSRATGMLPAVGRASHRMVLVIFCPHGQ